MGVLTFYKKVFQPFYKMMFLWMFQVVDEKDVPMNVSSYLCWQKQTKDKRTTQEYKVLISHIFMLYFFTQNSTYMS